jgi:hypothetical protein
VILPWLPPRVYLRLLGSPSVHPKAPSRAPRQSCLPSLSHAGGRARCLVDHRAKTVEISRRPRVECPASSCSVRRSMAAGHPAAAVPAGSCRGRHQGGSRYHTGQGDSP